MKKSILTIATIAFLATSLTSCGTSACECQKKAQQLLVDTAANPMDISIQEKSKKLMEECSKYTSEDFAACR